MQSQQIGDLFVGRKKEIALFEHWLTNDAPSAWILYFHDEAEEPAKKGGIGKTWLLREFARRARLMRPTNTAIVYIDFFNVVDRDRIAIATHVIERLHETFPEWTPNAFTRVHTEYFGASSSGSLPEKDVDLRIRDALFDALALDLQELEKKLAGNDKYLLLFFDTYEVIEDNPVIAVLGSSQTFPDTYGSRRVGAVVAGRNALNWSRSNWYGREPEVYSVPLAPFEQQEMLDYIDAGLVDEQPFQREEVETLYRLTAGRPILIGLVIDVLNHHVLSLAQLLAVPHEQFEERLVAQINHLENPLNWVILFMAHVYHRFNIETLDWIVHESHLRDAENIDYQHLIHQLPDLSFVRRAGTGDHFVLHDEMRRLVTRYCWEIQDTDRSIRQEISRCVVSYCAEKQSRSRLTEEEDQLYSIMKLYHLLFSDLEEGLAYFQQTSRDAVTQWRSAFARSLLQETRAFSSSFSAEQGYSLIFAGARLLRSEENPQAALYEHERLRREATDAWFTEQEIEILIEKGRCYLLLNQLREASECLNLALDLGKTRREEARTPMLLDLLGFIHRRRGELESAMKYYNECISIHKAAGNEVLYANTLNNLSNVLRLKGNIEEALRICKIALNLRRRLVEERQTGGRAVILSLNTLGLIYLDAETLGQAEQVLSEAIELARRSADTRKLLAMSYVRLGRVQFARGEMARAQELYKKAQETAEDTNPEALIASLNRQGRILLREGRLQEAVPLFTRALTLADQIHDSYQRVECLVDFAGTLERLGQSREAGLLWQQVRDISTQENYHLLQSRAEAARGDIYYNAGDFITAFEFYGRSCQYAVQHNQRRYNDALRRISDRLLEIPPEMVSGILASLIAFWHAIGYATLHPELIHACEQLQEFMSL
jgi:tetratricopeptide (TPR) repeat protein